MSVSVAKDIIQQILNMIRGGLVGPHTHSATRGGPIVTDLPITVTNPLAPALNCRTQILNENFNADLWRGQRYYSQSTQPQPSKVPVNKGDSWFDGVHQWQWTGLRWVEQANISDISASQSHPLLDGNIDSDTVASSPVRGGVIVGNSASKWAQQTLGTSGYYLRSNGTDLLYSALLMGDASGVLAVANGGTATSTAFTAGSVVFAGASGVYSQDNANLFYDATNKRLGIGGVPIATLDMIGPDSTYSELSIRHATVDATHIRWTFSNRDDNVELWLYGFDNASYWQPFKITWNNKCLSLVPDGVGQVGIGTQSPVSPLTVAGPISLRSPNTQTGSTYSQATTDSSIIINYAGTHTITLLAASSYTGQMLLIKTITADTVISASSNVVPLVGGAAGTAILAATAGKWALLQSNGSNWIIMAGN